MTIDERLEALTMNLELASRDIEGLRQRQRDALSLAEKQGEDIEALRGLAQKDGENIRALALIAQSHQDRLSNLEGR